MTGPETRIQRQMQATVRARGGYVLKVHGSPMMPNGTPDLLACYKGYFLAFEVKTPQTKTDVSPAQRLRLKQIRDAGGGAYVVWDVDRVEEILDSIDRMISVVDDALDSLPEEAAEGALDRWHRSVDK